MKLSEVDFSLPMMANLHGKAFQLQLMLPDDRDAFLTFTKSLPNLDRIYMRDDLSHPEAVDAWVEDVRVGNTECILAFDSDHRVVGYASLHKNLVSWTRHLAETRVFVSRELRECGLGRMMAEAILHVAYRKKVKIVQVHIPRMLPHLQKVLQRIGFRAEALLADWLIDPEGNTHDMIVMSFRFDECDTCSIG